MKSYAIPPTPPLKANGSITALSEEKGNAQGPLPPTSKSILAAAGRGREGETVEIVEFATPNFNDFNEFNAGGSRERIHPVPEDSILADLRDLAQEFSEAPDSFAIAPALALIGGALTPGTWWDFAGRKYPNLFQFVVGPPGVRKSTSFKLAESIGKDALPSDRFHEGNASDSAAFAKWQEQPHRIQLESEGNTVVTSWRGSYSGREIAARCLRLYDGESWAQTFRNQADKDGDGAEQRIECATLSLAIGATPSVCRFDGVDAKSGLRRRFGYYVADGPVRLIPWPKEMDRCPRFKSIVEGVRKIAELEGRFELDGKALRKWEELQKENRRKITDLGGIANEAAEIEAAELAEWPSRVLKLAAIFQACRWAKNAERIALLVDGDSLAAAAEHQDACLEASRSVERIANRAAFSEDAERILATIRAEASSLRDCDRWSVKEGCVVATKSEVTRRFAANGSRGGLSSRRLHQEVMPIVIALAGGRAEKVGATLVYRIPLEVCP